MIHALAPSAPTAQPHDRFRYRADIDGLRCIAVMSVIFYHFQIFAVSGGYVGVDVFFVISGFLIGRSVIDDIGHGRFSLVAFYERRIRRLYPAFFVVVLATIPVLYWIMLPLDLRSAGRSIVASVAYISNITFYKEAGYFDSAAIEKPFLHTWSLSLEEQFYVVFPIAASIVALLKVKWRVVILTLAFIISIVAAELWLSRDQPLVFFMLPFRAWELLLGVITSLLIDRFPARTSAVGNDVLGVIGVVLIVVSAVIYTDHTRFPGLAALVPCLGAALLIFSGAHTPAIANRGLASRIPRSVGLISYSLYLWHWPIFVLTSYYINGEIGIGLRLAMLAVVFMLAYLSWRYIEQPFRDRRRFGRKTIFLLAGLCSAILATVGYIFYRTDGMLDRFDGKDRPLVIAASDFLQHGGTCFDGANPEYPGLPYCKLGVQSAPPTFLVWGDSHGRAYRDGIHEAAERLGRGGLLVWSGGCPPVADLGKREIFDPPGGDAACTAANHRLHELIDQTPSLRSVILIGRWSYYLTGRGLGLDSANQITLFDRDGVAPTSDVGRVRLFDEQFLANVRFMRSRGLNVFVLEQTPEVPYNKAASFARSYIAGKITVPDIIARSTVPESEVKERQRQFTSLSSALARSGDVTVIPTHDYFCHGGRCSAWIGDAPALFDNNHVTVATSKKMQDRFLPAINAAR